MRTWIGRTALKWGTVLAVMAVAVTAGCTSAGQLHDAGQTRPVTSPPRPELLWPAADVSPQPSGSATAVPPPVPVPGVSVEGADIRAVDVRVLLGADPALAADERAALTGCAGCLVRPAQYRDVTGDGQDELLTAVITGDRRAFLHVYTVHEHQVLPVLALQALPGFSADTVARDLVVHEPTSEVTETNSTYRWDGVRMAFENRQIRATGPAADVPGCLPTASVSEPATPGPAVPRPGRTAPGSGAGPTVLPSAATGAAPSAAPSAAPAVPAVPSAVPQVDGLRPSPIGHS